MQPLSHSSDFPSSSSFESFTTAKSASINSLDSIQAVFPKLKIDIEALKKDFGSFRVKVITVMDKSLKKVDEAYKNALAAHQPHLSLNIKENGVKTPLFHFLQNAFDTLLTTYKPLSELSALDEPKPDPIQQEYAEIAQLLDENILFIHCKEKSLQGKAKQNEAVASFRDFQIKVLRELMEDQSIGWQTIKKVHPEMIPQLKVLVEDFLRDLENFEKISDLLAKANSRIVGEIFELKELLCSTRTHLDFLSKNLLSQRRVDEFNAFRDDFWRTLHKAKEAQLFVTGGPKLIHVCKDKKNNQITLLHFLRNAQQALLSFGDILKVQGIEHDPKTLRTLRADYKAIESIIIDYRQQEDYHNPNVRLPTFFRKPTKVLSSQKG